LPGAVQEQQFIINLKRDLPEPMSINLRIICEDQQLNELDEYIFGIRKSCIYEYYEEFSFKAEKKGEFIFILGGKAPKFPNYDINCKLYLGINNSTLITTDILMKTRVPKLECIKELYFEDERLIKLNISVNKNKKDVRVPFRLL